MIIDSGAGRASAANQQISLHLRGSRMDGSPPVRRPSLWQNEFERVPPQERDRPGDEHHDVRLVSPRVRGTPHRTFRPLRPTDLYLRLVSPAPTGETQVNRVGDGTESAEARPCGLASLSTAADVRFSACGVDRNARGGSLMRRTTQSVRPAVSITEPLIPTISADILPSQRGGQHGG